MDDKKKIVLGSEDFIAKGVDDIYININLQQTFNQIKKDKYDNNFDLAEQFRKERNTSRSFRIYGIIDSNIIDTDNVDIRIYKNSELTQYLGTITTTPLAYSEKNVFNKKKGKYLLELDNYDADLVYMQILGDNISYENQVFEQRLVYYNLEGEFVEYGTETVDVGLVDGGFLNIENNFPFFYNKHWIKKDLEVVEEKPTVMQFGTPASTVPEGNSISFDITMDKPSPFGNESVSLGATLGTVSAGDYSVNISGSPVNFPVTLNWAQGEQNKTITFDAITDDVLESSENIAFDLFDFQFTNSGLTTSHYVTIEDTTPRRITRYNIGEIYKNRLEFTGRTSNGPNTLPYIGSGYSILRNGLKFKKKQEAYYPGDTYDVIVTNEGINTLRPEMPSLGLVGEDVWPAGADKTFSIDTAYDGNEKHSIKLIFPTDPNQYNIGNLRVNGVRMPNLENQNILNLSSVAYKIADDSPQDWIPLNGYEKDFTAVSDGISAITITSKTTGIPVIVDIEPTFNGPDYPFEYNPPNPDYTPYIEEISPFVERNQIPKFITLYANADNNNSTNYSFRFAKPGYNGVVVSARTHTATSSGVDKYLVTSFEKVCRNWNGSQYMPSLGDDCIYTDTAMPELGYNVLTELSSGAPYLAPGTVTSVATNYFWPVGVAHINGTVFNTANDLSSVSAQIITQFRTADFKDSPLIVEPCTNSLINIKDIAQKVKITIPKFFTGNVTLADLYEANADAFRSFDYRTGTTGPYSTVYNNQSTFSNVNTSFFAWNGTASVSGATNSTATLASILEYGSPWVGYPNNTPTTIPSGPFFGLALSDEHNLMQYENDNVFYLESKIPGVPFEITNIKDAFVLTSASNIYSQEVIAGDYSAGAPLTVEEITPNAIAGSGLNIANNWMNGYNVEL
jgi:hypothetical protein